MATLRLTRALRHPNYRLFFAGQSVSLVGTWLTRVATSWLVYKLTGSAWTLGLVGFMGQLPTFILAPWAGVWVDRWDRHKVLVWTQVLAMLQSGLLAAFTLSGVVNVSQILWLSILQGIINAFDMPARQSFVVEMIEDPADLPNAIALNSSMVNMARLVGPSLAGILIATVGEGGCFAIDAVSYIFVIASLVAMKLPDLSAARALRKAKAQRGDTMRDLREGFRYVSRFRPIRAILLLLALVSLMGMPYSVLLPLIVSQRLGGGAHELGYLTALSGVGALTGALYLASRQSVLGLGRIIPASAAVFGLSLMGFAYAHTMFLALPLMFATGLGTMVQMAASNTLLQTLTDADKRGRVMSFFTMAFAGMAPFGSLLAGVMADRVGAPLTVALGGVACCLGAVAFARGLEHLRVEIRPIYRRLGILPELTNGLQQATDHITNRQH